MYGYELWLEIKDTKIPINISFQLLLYLIKVKYQQDQ